MKRFLLLFEALLAVVVAVCVVTPARAQFGQITYGTVPPVGSCGGFPQLAYDVTSNVLYTCGQNGVWQKSVTNSHSSSVVLPCVAASNNPAAYTCSTSPTFTPLFGDAILFKPDVTSTGPATLNVNSTSAQPVRKNGPITALGSGDFQANQNYVLVFDGTNWQLLQQPSQTILTNGTAVPPGTTQAQTPLTIPGITSSSVCYASFVGPGLPPSSWLSGIDVLPVIVSNNTATVLISNATNTIITPAAIVMNIKCIP